MAEGLESQDGKGGQAVFIDKGGITVGDKDQVQLMMLKRATLVGKGQGDSAKAVATITSGDDQ